MTIDSNGRDPSLGSVDPALVRYSLDVFNNMLAKMYEEIAAAIHADELTDDGRNKLGDLLYILQGARVADDVAEMPDESAIVQALRDAFDLDVEGYQALDTNFSSPLSRLALCKLALQSYGDMCYSLSGVDHHARIARNLIDTTL